ncbi:c-type cytochrome [Aestuariivita boseongensis]|uniref:c-type cytochrome n=1 Tax=Aestuariivita boseongensis TaxID=1470562 RepID=UPI00067FFB49|nr:c-type cytochrome [Aestuariivita boseongensis]
MNRLVATVIAGLLAAPAFADADLEAGAKSFDRKCALCHQVINDEGEQLAGKKAKTGPNLYNVFNRPLGSVEGFRYSGLIEAAHEQEIVLDEESFGPYTADPTAWLKEATGESGRSGMNKVRLKDDEVANIYAYLVSLSPAPEGEATN